MSAYRSWLRSLAAAGPVALAVACSGGEAASPPVAHVFHAAAPASIGPKRQLRRLSSREYDNVVRDLLGDATEPAKKFIADIYPNGFDNGTVALAAQSDQVDAYMNAAESLAANAVQGSMSRLVGDCDPSTAGASACLETLLSTFAPRAYRRPLTDSEKQRLRDAYAIDGPPSFAEGVQTVLEVILQSPQFLYREELGPIGSNGGSGTAVRLSDWEMASELSFLLTGSMPDDTLWAEVQAGAFDTEDDFRREALRLLEAPGARAAMRTFLHDWMGTNMLAGLSKDPAVYPSFNPQLAASMSGELDRLFDDVVWKGPGSLRELFTTSRGFADPTLAALYGVSVPAQAGAVPAVADTTRGTAVLASNAAIASAGALAIDAQFTPVKLDPRTRPGILTRAGFLSVNAAPDSSGPIARGVFLLGSILCTPPSPPPANVPPVAAATDPSAQGMTTRQRYAAHVSNSFCASCHDQIDGLGFGFEEFDGIGALRQFDNGSLVDDSGNVIGTGEIDGPFQGLQDLAPRIAGSKLLARCYALQAYRYAMGDVEAPRQDLTFLFEASTPDAHMTDAWLAIVTSSLFTTRNFE